MTLLSQILQLKNIMPVIKQYELKLQFCVTRHSHKNSKKKQKYKKCNISNEYILFIYGGDYWPPFIQATITWITSWGDLQVVAEMCETH